MVAGLLGLFAILILIALLVTLILLYNISGRAGKG